MASVRGGGFLKRLAKPFEGSPADPLRSESAAQHWLRALAGARPDEAARRLATAVNEPRPEAELTRDTLEARFALDAAATGLLRTLARRFVWGAIHRDAKAEDAWTAAFDLVQAFGSTYRPWLDEAPGGSSDRAWADAVGAAGTRYIHYRALERRLRALRHEQWIPGKWRDLFTAFEVVRALGGAQRPLTLGGTAAPSAEAELVWTLLFEMLSRGSFGVRELEWGRRYLRHWFPQLRLAPTGTRAACWVDPRSASGLRRPLAEGAPPAGSLYLDLSPVIARLRSRIGERGACPAVPTANVRRAATTATATKLLAILESFVGGQRQRAQRQASEATVRVVVGYDATVVNVAFTRQRRSGREMEMGYELRRPLARFVELNWPPPGSVPAGGLAVVGQIRDQSETGFRVAVPAAEWGLRTVGELIGIQEAETSAWRIGVVRRLMKPRADTIEVGAEVITGAPTCVRLSDTGGPSGELATLLPASESTVHALFVAPGRLPRPALLLPSGAYVRGRRMTMPTAHAAYELSLADPVESGPGWIVVRIDVLSKRAVEDAPPVSRAAGT
jgi:hypothetical protein